MISDKLHERIRKAVHYLQGFADRWWYAPLIAILATLDNFIVVIPNDGILISSSMLRPKRWLIYAIFIAIGSTVGGMLLAILVEHQGLPWILDIYPGVDKSSTWEITTKFFEQYGLLLVFFVAVTPLMQQPAVILASIAHTPLYKLTAVIFAGRLIKYLVMAYLGSHAPRLLQKMWGVKGELKDAGIELDETTPPERK